MPEDQDLKKPPTTVEDLGKLVKTKYPGSYDALSDVELGRKVRAKYPQYNQFLDMPDQWFKNRGIIARREQASREAQPGGGSFLGTAVSAIAGAPRAMFEMGVEPPETYRTMSEDLAEQRRQAAELRKQGRWFEAIGHEVAGRLPVVGPAAEHAAERFAAKQWGPGFAETGLLLAPQLMETGRAGLQRLPPFRRMMPEVELPPEVARRAREVRQAYEAEGGEVSAGERTERPGVQEREKLLINLPGSEKLATQFYLRRRNVLGRWGERVTKQTAPTSLDNVSSGQALRERLTTRIEDGISFADKSYDWLRARTARVKKPLQTGTRQVPGPSPAATLTPAGMPRTVPVMTTFETPVPLSPIRQGLRGFYDDMLRLMPDAQKAASPAWTTLKDLMSSDAPAMNAMDLDRSLSAIKTLVEKKHDFPINTQSQRLAYKIINQSEQQLTKALAQISPKLVKTLERARATVRGYHQTADLLELVGQEPAQVFDGLTARGDTQFNTLMELKREAPKAVQTIARTWIEGLLEKATDPTTGRVSGLVLRNGWRKLGPRTKLAFFGGKLTQDITNLVDATRRYAPPEGSPTAARQAALGNMLPLGGLLGFEPMLRRWAGPHIEARLLLTEGGARLLTEGITLPRASPRFKQVVRGINALGIQASRDAEDDRRQSAGRDVERYLYTTPEGIPVYRRESQPSSKTEPRAGLYPNPRRELTAAAERHQLPPALLHAVAQTESSGDPHAVSGKGATGLMQLMPATARQYGVRDIRNVAENIEGSARYLRHLWTKYRGNVALVAAAYNAGEGAVDRHGGVPPYQETREYVRRVMSRMQRPG